LVAFDYPATSFAAVLEALLPYEPAVVNIMHTPPDAVARALTEVRSRWRGFVGVYPEIDSAAEASHPVTPQALAALGATWVAAGARVLGGCCGTGPEHIRALKEHAAH
jgi:methionine synthase I (cobalamin-dependent)